MKRKFAITILLAMVLAACLSCTTLKETWDKATPRKKTNIVVYDLQIGLAGTLRAGSMYVDMHPDKRASWQTKVLPISELCNKALKDAAVENWTWDVISAKASGYISEITAIIISWGVKKEEIEAQKIKVKKEGLK